MKKKILQVTLQSDGSRFLFLDDSSTFILSSKEIGGCVAGDVLDFDIAIIRAKKVKMYKWLLKFQDGAIRHTDQFLQYIHDAQLEAARYLPIGSVTVIGLDDKTMIEVEE